ncbi:winged helix-turn-helix domain-containing protein [Micromonospora sp. HK10]|uniref:winged helix-turn-helix domain-containing protein n=1 Tax=Micromonospora sp. HK10 TaxID=1538294 RepID=UPI0009E4615E|nr:winged helix-turn-helix domain-containing protein [Micromonospora sp. HK10]
MTEDDTGPAGAAEPPSPLVIAVTPVPADRLRIAELLDGVAPLLVVADLDELRRLLAARAPATRPDAAVAAEPPLAAGPLLVDPTRSTARAGEREIALTRLERDLLTCLASDPVRAWSYPELHRSVWGDADREHRADVQSVVKRLRRKLDRLGGGVTIVAVRGVGFRLAGWRDRGPSPDSGSPGGGNQGTPPDSGSRKGGNQGAATGG